MHAGEIVDGPAIHSIYPLLRAFFAFSASREPKMDRVRPAMLIAALVVDVGRRLPRRCGSAVPPPARLIRV